MRCFYIFKRHQCGYKKKRCLKRGSSRSICRGLLGKAHVPLFVLGVLTVYVMMKALKQSPNGIEGMAARMNIKKKEK